MMIESLIEANSSRELQAAIAGLSAQQWQARSSYLLNYDDRNQRLLFGGQALELQAEHQPGACALSLRPSVDQALQWPDILKARGDYRMVLPIFNWGSLNAVLCLAFDRDPGELQGLKEVQKTLGVIGEKVAHREMALTFMGRSKELFVQAVEARGKKGHVQRCSRLCSALAAMLDCSAQVQADLLDACQFHDIGLLTFENPSEAKAVREHPLVGASLMRCHPESFALASLVESHHERYDGSGMPHGKSGDELPLESWILALVEEFVEFWEASLTPYEAKVKAFFEGPARHHHPDVVDALCGLVDSEKLKELI